MLNLLIWHTGSSGAIPLGAFFSLVSLWFIISIPLCYSGAAVRLFRPIISIVIVHAGAMHAQTSSTALQVAVCRQYCRLNRC